MNPALPNWFYVYVTLRHLKIRLKNTFMKGRAG